MYLDCGGQKALQQKLYLECANHLFHEIVCFPTTDSDTEESHDFAPEGVQEPAQAAHVLEEHSCSTCSVCMVCLPSDPHSTVTNTADNTALHAGM